MEKTDAISYHQYALIFVDFYYKGYITLFAVT